MITEEIKAKAKEFAFNALQGQIDALADAYLKGYEDALKTVPHEPIEETCDTFVDLMFGSGTLWTDNFHKSSKGIGELNYYEALQYGLPTKEQFEELFAECKRKGYYLVGKNGRKIYMPQCLASYYVWVKSELVGDIASAYYISSNGPKLVKMYAGTKHQFYCVKNKNEE